SDARPEPSIIAQSSPATANIQEDAGLLSHSASHLRLQVQKTAGFLNDLYCEPQTVRRQDAMIDRLIHSLIHQRLVLETKHKSMNPVINARDFQWRKLGLVRGDRLVPSTSSAVD
ncbi:hypothetical protein E4U22_007666, partial [Claviceps purpurea]